MKRTSMYDFETGEYLISDDVFRRGEVVDFALRLARERNCTLVVDDRGKRYLVLPNSLRYLVPEDWKPANGWLS